MIESIPGWLNRTAAAAAGPRNELPLALAALLVEAACSDDRFDEGEGAFIARALERRFNLAEDAARIELIEMLSEVTYADGALEWCERGTARRRVIGRCRLDRTIRFPAPAPGVEIQEKKTLP